MDVAFGSGPLDHVVLVGVDYRSTTQLFTSQDGNTIDLDLFTPNYDELPRTNTGPPSSSKETYADLGFHDLPAYGVMDTAIYYKRGATELR